MRTKFNGFLTLVLVFMVQFTFAQQTITGKVSDDSGPLPGVSVLIKGTTTGTETDFDGNYAIEATKGDILEYSFIGMETVTKRVADSNSINVVMSVSSENVLGEVIVTAQGVKREKKALGYAVTVVDAEQVEQKPEGDLSRVLQGKIAGVNIIPTGGMAGSGTSVSIRSQISIEGNNQPLYVVDGVPFNSNTNATENFTGPTGGTASSRSLDLDPNNIASISVLKGFSATVLYGNQGRNGVILITTKNGKVNNADKKFEVTVSQSTAFAEISNLPEYQNKYGGGSDLNYNNGYVGNWGPEFDREVMVAHMYDQVHITDVFPEYAGLEVPFVAVPNNVSDFFETGIVSSTSINAGKSTENSGYNLNFGKTNENGYIPENELDRLTFGLGGNAKLSNNFTFDGTFNYVKTKYKAPPIPAANGSNGGSSIFTRLLFIPRNFDIMNLPFENPVDGSSVYYRTDQDNPRWLLNNAGSTQNVDRFFGKIGLGYDFNENLGLKYRVGIDHYTETQTSYSNKGGTTAGLTDFGFLRQVSGLNNIFDHNLMLNGNGYKFGNNFGLNFILGASVRNDKYDETGLLNTNQVVFGFLDNSNFANQESIQGNSEENTLGVYGQFEFDVFETLYITLAARNDWTSTLEKENNSQFYPSASFSFLPTKLFEGLRGDVVNFLKIRGGYASTAGYPNPYNTRPRLNVSTTENGGTIGGITTQTIDDVLPNPNLKPELHTETEVGLEGKFFKNRMSLDLSLYQRVSTDQILGRSLDDATGYTSTFVNLGRVDTEGIEVGLGIIPFKNDNFSWNINTNFSAYETIVKELPEGSEKIQFSGFTNLGNFAVEGEPLGVIYGSYALRDDNGNYLIDFNDGTVIDSDADAGLEDKIIGDPNPDWKASLINSISYKGFTLSGQLEYTQGGDIYSLSASTLWRRGVTEANIMDREGAVVLPGTLADPSTGELVDPQGNPLPEGAEGYANHIPVTVNSVYFINTMDNSAESVYDGTVIRLREVSLTYDFDKDLIKRTPFGSLSLTLSGQNLWFDAVNFPDAFNFDPEVVSTGVGNGSGLEFQTAPSSKKYGFSIKATF